MQLIDSFGRQINYLRLSITDRCNLRCFYCMPEGGVHSCMHEDVLSYEELKIISETAVSLGIEKIRITGGEPLVRQNLVPFLSQLSGIPGLHHLAISTNGLLLPKMARDLYFSGVQRLNVSLDSLKADKFEKITRGGKLKNVLDGLEEAIKVGFPAPKLNIVAMRGINDDEILDFVEMTRTHGHSIRFIEYMPTLKKKGWQDNWISGQEILDLIATRYPLEEVDKGAYAGPSKDFRIPGARGTIGIITAISGHFCGQCNRIRITSQGKAKGCLFSNHEVDLNPWLKKGDRASVAYLLQDLVLKKPERHAMTTEGYEHNNFVMSQVGG